MINFLKFKLLNRFSTDYKIQNHKTLDFSIQNFRFFRSKL